MELTHFNENGRAKIVDITDKKDTHRVAIASGKVIMKTETISLIKQGAMSKGDVLNVAQIGGIMGAKKTSDIIPMCHVIGLTGCDIDFYVNENHIEIRATAKTTGKTGVEMEALTAVSVAALTIYDMCKAVDKTMEISQISLEYKDGGKSGEYKKEL